MFVHPEMKLISVTPEYALSSWPDAYGDRIYLGHLCEKPGYVLSSKCSGCGKKTNKSIETKAKLLGWNQL